MSDTRTEILNLIAKAPLGPTEIADVLGVSRQTIHKYLRVLVQDGALRREGEGAHVTYAAESSTKTESRVEESLEHFTSHLLPVYKRRYGRKVESSYKKYQKKQSTSVIDFEFFRDMSVLYSSKIEGNTLDINSYLNSKNKKRIDKGKEAQEIDDLSEAYELAPGWILNEKNTLKLHSLIGKSFISLTRRGVYRKESVGVFSKRGIEYLATPASMVESEMREYFELISDLLKRDHSVVETLFFASWVHLTFELIHPFSDGNGRVGRLIEKWFLATKLDSDLFYLPTEEYYFKNRSAYYRALNIGVNYFEVDFNKAQTFLSLLPEILQANQ